MSQHGLPAGQVSIEAWGLYLKPADLDRIVPPVAPAPPNVIWRWDICPYWYICPSLMIGSSIVTLVTYWDISSLVWSRNASFSTSKTCIQTNCQMSRPFWFLSFVLVMCVMCESQRNRIPSWKKGRGSVLSGVLQLVQVSHMSLLLQSGKHPYRVLCSNTTGRLFHSIWVSEEGGQGGTSNHHESLASHPNPCIPVVPVYTCVCY